MNKSDMQNKLKRYKAKWRRLNKTRINEVHKIWRLKNPEKVRIWNSNYAHQYMICSCGKQIKNHSIDKHLKTRDHMNRLSSDLSCDLDFEEFEYDYSHLIKDDV